MIKFKAIQDLSIKNKIVAIILVVSYLCMSLGFTFFALWNINRLKIEIQSELTINAKLIGDNCIVPLTFNDKQQATKALSRLRHIKFIEIACLHDKDGNLFASYPDALNHDSLTVHNKHYNNINKDGYFYVQESVIFNDELYGTIFLKANSQPLTHLKRTLLSTLSLLSFVLFILSYFIARSMQRYISSPIINLKEHVDRIAKSHDFTASISRQNNDEIGSLYDGFNNLILQIQKRSKERDAAEVKFKDSQNKLNLALLGGGIGVWEWDLGTDLTIWDARMENMFGLAEGEFKQTYEAFKECLHPDDITITENAIKNALDGIKPYDIIYRVIWKNKEVKYIKAKALVSKDSKDNPIKLVGVCIDITEIKKAEEELKEHKEELEDIVNERTKELELKYSELENMNEIFVGREFRIAELKEANASLKEELKSRKNS